MRWIVWVIDMATNQRDRVHVSAPNRESAFNKAEQENPGCMAYDAEQIPEYDCK